MSIANEIERLRIAKSDIKQSLINKGVTVSDEDTISTYASKIDSIPEAEPIDPLMKNIGNISAGITYKLWDMTVPTVYEPLLKNITNSIYEEV